MAAAALIVAAAMACAGVKPMYLHASARTNCMDSFQAVPGLQSVASASKPLADSNSLAGVYCASDSPNGVHGRATATVFRDPPSASMSASDVLTRGSAEVAPSSTGRV